MESRTRSQLITKTPYARKLTDHRNLDEGRALTNGNYVAEPLCKYKGVCALMSPICRKKRGLAAPFVIKISSSNGRRRSHRRRCGHRRSRRRRHHQNHHRCGGGGLPSGGLH